MPGAVIAQIGALALAGVTVVASAYRVPVGRWVGGIVYGIATASGVSLMVALPAADWLLGLALIPLTVLSAIHFARVVQRWKRGWVGWAVMLALLMVGAAALLSQTPVPLTRAVLTGDETPVRTITPGASRPVRG